MPSLLIGRVHLSFKGCMVYFFISISFVIEITVDFELDCLPRSRLNDLGSYGLKTNVLILDHNNRNDVHVFFVVQSWTKKAFTGRLEDHVPSHMADMYFPSRIAVVKSDH